MSEEVQCTIADLTYVRRLRDENADLRRQLAAFEALLVPPVRVAPAPAVAAIATRWQDVRWRAVVERERNYVANVALGDIDGVPLLDLAEPNPDELATIELAAQAPDDIRLLLALARRLDRMENAVRTLIEARATAAERLATERERLATEQARRATAAEQQITELARQLADAQAAATALPTRATVAERLRLAIEGGATVASLARETGWRESTLRDMVAVG